jgi:predicted MPP superfamily phosphohydrolase
MIDLVLLLGAGIGHIAVLSFSLNRWYAHPFPHRFLTCVRMVHGGLVLLGLCGLAWAAWHHFFLSTEVLEAPDWHTAVAGYALFCVLIGLVWVPFLSLLRRWRGVPAALASNHTQTIDVAAQLGYKPVGQTKYRRLAGLPGNEVFRVDLAQRSLVLSRLPAAWDGLTILHLSDLHFCGTPDRLFFRHVFEHCRNWDPDLVAITGDIVDSEWHHRWVLPLLGRLRWRVAAFAILGNHDSWFEHRAVRRRLQRLGMHVLGNGWRQMEVRGEPMVVIGHEGPWFRPGPDLTACPEKGFRLCLSHTPDNIRWARQHGVDLMLAGHNHGGQIRFPFIGSVLVPSRYGRRYDCGTFHEPPTVLHVSRGLGGRQPLRFNCRPEVTKLILQTATNALPPAGP